MQNNPVEIGVVESAAEHAAQAAAHGLALRIEGVDKTYAGRKVLDNLSLDIAPGEFVAIVGRSGCGKSTLLRLVAGLEPADPKKAGGLILADGAPVQGLNPAMRIMFQDARLLPWRHVLPNVALGLPKAELPKALETLGQVGLAERANEWPAVLSGGQRQRVALARALVHEPRLLLLDEPLGALDALTRIEMQQLIESLWRKHGFTALLVTHDVSEAIALADRVVLIENGRIALDERVDLPRPRERGSAAFAALEERVLRQVLGTPAAEPEPEAARGNDLPFRPQNWAV
jgi:sulfonate transport system ATP-binding protein